MTTKVTKTRAREVEICGQPYTVRLSTRGIKLARKGHRIGVEHTWAQLASENGWIRLPVPPPVVQPFNPLKRKKP